MFYGILMRGRAALAGSLILAGLMASAQSPVVPPGAGSAADPYRVSEFGHLVWMGGHVAESGGRHYRLMNDIDAGGEVIVAGWDDGVGDAFTGEFDGNGHVIWRLSGPLFTTVGEGGSVQNLALVGGSVAVRGLAGGLASQNNGGVICGCLVSGAVTGEWAGGLVGHMYGGVLERCVSSGFVSGLYCTGGLVAELLGGSVTQCLSSATLKGDGRGGLTGWCIYWADPPPEALVTDSFWDAEAAGTTVSWRGGVGLSAAAMMRAASFEGWDFERVWGVSEGASTPYSRLFPPPFSLNVVTQGVGRIDVAPMRARYQPGERVTLTAHSDAPGSVFSHWLGGASNLLTTVTTVTLTGHRTLSAAFEPATDLASVEELQAVSDMGGNYRLAQDIDAWATTNWNGGAGFVPLGGEFSGIFDGNGHVIRGLTINGAGGSAVGLFAATAPGGLVRRVGLEGGSVKSGADIGCVGALVGFGEACVLEECYATLDVSGPMSVGGLVGRMESWTSGRMGRIVKCFATGAVRANNAEAYSAGGLIGYLEDAYVSDCYAMGNVECMNDAGGLIGEGGVWSVIPALTRCFATGAVKGRIGVGGLVGVDHGTVIRQCFATGEVSGRNEVCGLIGNGGTYVTSGMLDGKWLTSLGESYALGRQVSICGDNGGLTMFELKFFPTAYWDVDTSWVFSGSGLQGKHTAQMKQAATYEGWDFTNAWMITEGVSYPYLRGVGDPFRLHVVSEGPGRVLVSPQKPFYAPGEVVTLTALPDAATHMLAWWRGLVSDEDASVTTVTMDTHKTVTAVFVTPQDIGSLADLQRIGTDPAFPVSGAYRLTQDIDAGDTAGWNSGAGFLPIAQPCFDGLLDGQGHVIRGLTINRLGERYAGLIGLLGLGGVVRNIGVADCSVAGGSSSGGLVGYNVRGRVTRSFVHGSVGGDKEQGTLVGYNEGIVSRCYASGTLAASSRAGGLVGVLSKNGMIRESYSSAAVAAGADVGGLLGLDASYAHDSVTGAYWDAEASGRNTSAAGEGRSTADMMRQSTYAGWNFSTEWGIEEDASYPFLWRFRLALPPGVGLPAGEALPAYAAWAASRTNAWGTADFSGVPARDFETAWLLDQRPEAGLAEASGLAVAGFEVGATEIRVTLALTAAGGAKQGRVNGWLAVQGKPALPDAWVVVAVQPTGGERISFVNGASTVTFARPADYAFFRPVLLPSCADAAIPLHQVAQ